MNNFPAMTEAQRQELIKYLIGAIEAIDLDCALGWRINAQYRLPFQIALAALTAKPDITVLFDKHRREGNVMPNYNEMPTVVSCNWKPDGEHRYYTAPPAPVLCSPDYHDEAKRLAELHGMSFVVFRHGEAPAVADPTRVFIGFTDKGLGHDTTGGQQ